MRLTWPKTDDDDDEDDEKCVGFKDRCVVYLKVYNYVFTRSSDSCYIFEAYSTLEINRRVLSSQSNKAAARYPFSPKDSI